MAAPGVGRSAGSRVISGLLAACALLQAFVLASLATHGTFGRRGGDNDFTCFYVVGRSLSGHSAAQLYDWPMLASLVASVTGHGGGTYLPWLYPPSLLLLFQPLAALPMAVAHLVWSLGTLALFAGVLGAIAGPLAALAALACPLTLSEAVMGQTGFLNASLLGGALLLADRRPGIAGILAGLLACKPQLALLLPLMLLATQNWRALLAAGLTVLATVAASAWLYGVDSWTTFALSLSANSDALANGRLVPWWALESLYGLLRRLGSSHDIAIAAQGSLALAAAGAVVLLCLRPASHETRAACVAIGTALASPYLLLWDLALLGVAMAFLGRLMRQGPCSRWQVAAFFALGLAPVVPLAFHVPVGVPCCGVLIALMLSSLHLEHRSPLPRQSATPIRGPMPTEA